MSPGVQKPVLLSSTVTGGLPSLVSRLPGSLKNDIRIVPNKPPFLKIKQNKTPKQNQKTNDGKRYYQLKNNKIKCPEMSCIDENTTIMCL